MGAEIDTLREKLHIYIDKVEDKKIKAFYTIFKSDLENEIGAYHPDFKNEMEKRQREYKTDKVKMVTASESKQRIKKILKST
ncbi:MAG: hypothetical protein WCR21_01880 [Bacteroidota bacterium]